MRAVKILSLLTALVVLHPSGAQAQGGTPGDAISADPRFGAIAVAAAQPLSAASASNYTTLREASSAARRACARKGGQGCQTAVTFEESCGALASGSDGKWVAVASTFRDDARTDALNKCQNSGLSGCKVEIVACASDPS